MFEVDSALAPVEVDHLTDWMLLELLQDDTDARARADRRRLRYAERFIALTRVETDSGEDHAGWDDQGMVEVPGFLDTLGGEGTPLIGIDAPVQWAAHSGRSVVSAKHYLANTMDLTYRLPQTRALVEEFAVSVWTAFNLAEATRGLSFECARWIDQRLAEHGRYGQKAVDMWVKSGIARFHPDLVQGQPGVFDKDDWDVRMETNPNGLPGGGNGTSTLEAIGDTIDLKKFLDAVSDEAATAGRLGDTDTFAQRKAKALGAIADRQATLDLAGLLDVPNQNNTHSVGQDGAEGGDHADHGNSANGGDGGEGGPGPRGSGFRPTVNADGDLVHPETGKRIQRRRSYGKARFFVHLTGADLAAFAEGDATRVGHAGVLGAQMIEQLTAWLQAFGPDAKITPVIDLDAEWSVDRHDPPEQMREQVMLRDEHCVFPNCTVDARLCDLDHIDAFVEDGPPGQTSPEKLACLCRRHHLVKTHDGWTYRRCRDGTYRWTSPLGRKWLVTKHGSIDIPDN